MTRLHQSFECLEQFSNFLTVCSNSDISIHELIDTNISSKYSEHLAFGGLSAFLKMLKLVYLSTGDYFTSELNYVFTIYCNICD